MKIASIESRSKVIASSRGCPCGGSAKDEAVVADPNSKPSYPNYLKR